MKDRIVTIVVALLLIWISVKYATDTKSLKAKLSTQSLKCDSLQHVADSLHWELLPTQIELGRHLVAYDIFMERNPKAAKQYDNIISSETE